MQPFHQHIATAFILGGNIMNTLLIAFQRGGIHNSVTRAVLKPTHMIGGYAQLAYGFNYYGTVGSNRDEFVVVRRMKTVDWLERPHPESMEAAQ